MSDENTPDPTDLDALSPEEREAAQQALQEIQTDAKVNFKLADWMAGGTPKKGNVLVYRDLDAVAAYAEGQKRLAAVESDLLELSKNEAATDEEINAAKSRQADAEEEVERLKTTMLEGALNIEFRPIPGDLDDRLRGRARKQFYPGGKPIDENAQQDSADWLERTSLGHGIKSLRTAHGPIEIEDRDRLGHDLKALLDFTQWQRLITTWTVYRFGDAVADAAVSDPGF